MIEYAFIEDDERYQKLQAAYSKKVKALGKLTDEFLAWLDEHQGDDAELPQEFSDRQDELDREMDDITEKIDKISKEYK